MESSTPVHYQDGLDILACKILVWEPANKNVIDKDDPSSDRCLTDVYKRQIEMYSYIFQNYLL